MDWLRGYPRWCAAFSRVLICEIAYTKRVSESDGSETRACIQRGFEHGLKEFKFVHHQKFCIFSTQRTVVVLIRKLFLQKSIFWHGQVATDFCKHEGMSRYLDESFRLNDRYLHLRERPVSHTSGRFRSA